MSDNDEKPKLTGRGGPGRGQGRKPGIAMTQVSRERIRVGMLVNKLHRHVLKDEPMSPTQVRAAEVLLRKALPDLSSTEHTGLIEHRTVHDYTDAELLALIDAAGSAGSADAPAVEGEPSSVH